MSRSVYIGFDRHGFWAFDVISNIFVKHLIDAAIERVDQPDHGWLRDQIAHWRANAVVPDCGDFIFGADTWTPEQIKTFTELATEACERLSRRAQIPADEIASWPILDNMRIFPRGLKCVSTAAVIRLGRAAIQAVNGTLPDPPPGTWWYFGPEEEPRTTPKLAQ